MSGGYTPGPWGVGYNEPRRLNFGGDTRFWVILDAEGFSPAIVPPWDIGDSGELAPDEAEANARLIAAAPELVEALRLWLHYDGNDEADGVEIMLDYANALEATKAILARIEGAA